MSVPLGSVVSRFPTGKDYNDTFPEIRTISGKARPSRWTKWSLENAEPHVQTPPSFCYIVTRMSKLCEFLGISPPPSVSSAVDTAANSSLPRRKRVRTLCAARRSLNFNQMMVFEHSLLTLVRLRHGNNRGAMVVGGEAWLCGCVRSREAGHSSYRLPCRVPFLNRHHCSQVSGRLSIEKGRSLRFIRDSCK
jgi:hypothetical protein